MKIKTKISNKRIKSISKEEINFQKQSLATSKKANKISIANAVATFFIALFGLLISILSYHTYQNQLDLEKINSRPIINIEIFYNNDKSKIDGLEITNEGALTGNIEVDIIPYLSVCTNDISRTDNIDTTKTIYLPIKYSDYYIRKYNTKKGLICNADFTEICEKNIEDFTEMLTLDMDNTSSEFVVTQVSIEYLINISYQDVLGNDCKELYHCTPNYHVERCSTSSHSYTSNIIEMDLEAVENNDSLSKVYNNIGKPNIIAFPNGPAYYRSFGATPSEKFNNFKDSVTDAYEKEQFID